MKGKGAGFFWPSFTDLMTSLFFIMLVLYVLTFLKLTYQQRATEEQLKKIKEIQAAVTELPREYFAYDSVYKRFSLVQNIEFDRGKDILKPADEVYLSKVGTSISKLIKDLAVKYAGQDIKYVVIIEGMASNDNYSDNFPLSYKRAWAVLKLWQSRNIVPDPNVCEVQVAGSGTGGIGRYAPGEESRNQRILIQIVPKIGEIKIE
ncbi:OmpA family protein [Chitinophaga sancti]|uniref:OmpA family protein n=1 Tax=Chitinophaga sancti TaxID=1004 RepID=A0A1K1SGS4_9BACT|nr:OmpA family protein [Chitinophaga sancti]WQD59865.1 OmpA family protein [Chitinophaga sancti]WQG88004.1 OmpA family protein [Chitinophaga sancti]SFW83332.1 OmpA family protein [Chitinophaga sancti]